MTDPELLSRMKPVLTDLLDRIEQERHQAALNAGTVNLDQSSVGRLSRMDALQQQAMAQASLQRLATQQRRVQAALARVAQGSYGICCECGGEVGLMRLQSDPATPFCMACQVERDASR